MALQTVADVAEIPVGCARAVDAGGQPVAVVHVADGVVKAIHNVCSHQYYELAPEGVIEESTIRMCAARVDLRSRHGGGLDAPALDPIPVYVCEVVDGEVLVDVARQRNDDRPPRH
jgi:3-phenylpropionate/trans-cinnamate dioxygenase ferredoxin component